MERLDLRYLPNCDTAKGKKPIGDQEDDDGQGNVLREPIVVFQASSTIAYRLVPKRRFHKADYNAYVCDRIDNSINSSVC
ncbi:Hypothetical protein NTJ_04730 [Nesidiocoris tenuis]|uniref:Uncharacterized protein n=1 Tax=Nesidiocoris tenuis TaxID=355587 RepID=A0ABN7AKU0_9HEMI|nr:Hypothetical protein NTJ_04730 [Nesidiocoris tenuis]